MTPEPLTPGRAPFSGCYNDVIGPALEDLCFEPCQRGFRGYADTSDNRGRVGSTDSLYEPPYHSQGLREVLPGCGYSPAPLRPTGPGWGGSDPCISPNQKMMREIKERASGSAVLTVTTGGLWVFHRCGQQPPSTLHNTEPQVGPGTLSAMALWGPGLHPGIHLRPRRAVWRAKQLKVESRDPTTGSILRREMEAVSQNVHKMRPVMKQTRASSGEWNKETGQGDRSQDKVSGGHMFTGGRPSRSSNSLESLYSLNSGQSSSSGVTSGSTCSSNRNSLRLQEENLLYSRQCCARARVHTDFVPSPYDMESLRLKVGDVIDVIAKPTMGIWTGMLNGKIGSFKFVYVDVLEDRESDKYQSHKQHAKSRPETLEDLLKPHSLEECCNILRLHGYRGVEDLARLREHHLMDEIGPEDRCRLLAAVEALREPQCGSEWGRSNMTPTGSGAVDPRTRPRDSGCHVPSDGSDNGRDDSEINFPFISPATLDQISAV
ncbi:unnamed protein product [Merluccius merluccius]